MERDQFLFVVSWHLQGFNKELKAPAPGMGDVLGAAVPVSLGWKSIREQVEIPVPLLCMFPQMVMKPCSNITKGWRPFLEQSPDLQNFEMPLEMGDLGAPAVNRSFFGCG